MNEQDVELKKKMQVFRTLSNDIHI